MSSQMRPSFFCSRPNGSLTPLIALDDFPVGVNVRGVSRTLTPGDTQGMISCGSAEPRSEPWDLEGSVPGSRGTIASKEDLAALQSVLFKIMADDNVSTELRMAIKGILYRGLDASYVGGSIPTKAVTGRQSTSPGYHGFGGHSGHNHASGGKHGFGAKKEFCSYWIRHGECDYQQQGCMYKHEMPTDIFMLEKLGLRDIPRWYREKYDVPSLLQAGQGNQQRGQQQQAAIDQPQQRAIQYRPAANNLTNPGRSANAGPAANAGSSAHTGPSANVGASAHAGPSPNAVPSRNAGASRSAGPSGNINAADEKTNANANGNHHGHAQPRGSIKGRNNPNAGKNGHNSGVAAPVVNNANGTPASASPNMSNSSTWSVSPRGGQLPMATPIDRPLTQGNQTLDRDSMAAQQSLVARLRALSTEDTYGGSVPAAVPAADPLKNLYRTKSRFNFGADGDLKAKAAKAETGKEATPSASTSMIGQLVATSEPINPNEPLFYWGPIGRPVQRPVMYAANAYTVTHPNNQGVNGHNAQFTYPYMGRH
ncbi:Putative C-x8-C-x5-C-x3-H type zinc finger protein [Penicillium brasilianum]|uniref:Putative C-x8-C-x5-C-x3-H type zinc finger protein n=1 Tax=Penicillium brasilianum TaxID=104259 RepID=A0A0F7VJI2_PENBI|nr:Putative C-x8-C-x5-C-x3-H type zinc finger protein [Penicillium brasilianum]